MSDLGTSKANMADPKPNEKGSQEFTPAVAFAMGEIKGTVENLRTDLREWKGDLASSILAGDQANATKITDLELRMRALERWKWMVVGAAGAGGVAGGKILEWLAKVAT